MAKGAFRTKSRRLAFMFLVISGSLVIILGLIVLSVGLAITHNDTFHTTIVLEEQVKSTIDYVQYWIGIPYIITGMSVACSAVNLRRISLTAWTIFVSLTCVVLSLAGLVVDGPDWVWWKNFQGYQKYWEGQDGFACSSTGDTCICENGATTKTIISFADCETLTKLSSIYGILIGSFVFGLVLLLASVFLIVYFVTSKREKAKREGRTYQSTDNHKIIEVTPSEPTFERPGRGTINQGYEYPVALQRTQEPEIPVSYREYQETKIPDSVSQQNVEGSSIVDNGGVVMMDPGRFRLGDDDIY